VTDEYLVPGCTNRPWLREHPTSQSFGVERADRRGRVRVTLGTSHEYANTGGWQYRYILTVNYTLGRRLLTGEHVHHEDLVVYHDVLPNLTVVHASHHGREHAYLQTLAGCRGPDGRFVEYDTDHPPVIRGTRYKAIISHKSIDELHGPECRRCEGTNCPVCNGTVTDQWEYVDGVWRKREEVLCTGATIRSSTPDIFLDGLPF